MAKKLTQYRAGRAYVEIVPVFGGSQQSIADHFRAAFSQQKIFDGFKEQLDREIEKAFKDAPADVKKHLGKVKEEVSKATSESLTRTKRENEKASAAIIGQWRLDAKKGVDEISKALGEIPERANRNKKLTKLFADIKKQGEEVGKALRADSGLTDKEVGKLYKAYDANVQKLKEYRAAAGTWSAEEGKNVRAALEAQRKYHEAIVNNKTLDEVKAQNKAREAEEKRAQTERDKLAKEEADRLKDQQAAADAALKAEKDAANERERLRQKDLAATRAYNLEMANERARERKRLFTDFESRKRMMEAQGSDYRSALNAQRDAYIEPGSGARAGNKRQQALLAAQAEELDKLNRSAERVLRSLDSLSVRPVHVRVRTDEGRDKLARLRKDLDFMSKSSFMARMGVEVDTKETARNLERFQSTFLDKVKDLEVDIDVDDEDARAALLQLKADIAFLENADLDLDVDSEEVNAARARIAHLKETVDRMDLEVHIGSEEAERRLQTLQAKLQRFAEDDFIADIGVDLNEDQVQAQRAEIEGILASIEDEDVLIDIDDAKARADLQALRARLEEIRDKRLSVDVDVDDAELSRIKGELAAIGQRVHKMRVDVADDDARAALRRLESALAAIRGKTVGVDITTKDAVANIAVIQAALATLKDKNIRVDIDRNTLSGFVSQLGSFNRNAKDSERRMDKLAASARRAGVSFSESTQAFRGFSPMVALISVVGAPVVTTLGALTAAVGGLVSILPGAIGSVGALGFALKGLGEGMGAYQGMMDEARRGTGAATAGGNAAAKAAQSVAKATQRAAIDAKYALEDARISYKDTMADIQKSTRDAERDISRTFRDAVRSAKEARALADRSTKSKFADQKDDAKSSRDAALGPALEKLEELERESAARIETMRRESADRIAAIERESVEKVRQIRGEADEKINKLRGEANQKTERAEQESADRIRALTVEANDRRARLEEDYADRIARAGSNAKLVAELRNEEARKVKEIDSDLAKKIAEEEKKLGKKLGDERASSGKKIADAEKARDKKIADEKKARQKKIDDEKKAQLKRIKDEQTAEEKRTKSARDRIAKIHADYAAKVKKIDRERVQELKKNAEVEARALRDAREERARSLEDAKREEADATARAERDHTRAKERIKRQQEEAAEQAKMAASFTDTAASVGKVSAATDKWNEAMKSLGPEGVAFIKWMDEAGEKLNALQRRARKGFLPGLQTGLDTILNTYAGPFGDFLEDMGYKFGEVSERWGKLLSSPSAAEWFGRVGEDASKYSDDFLMSAENFAIGLGHLVDAFRPFAYGMSEWLVTFSEGFRDWAAGLAENEKFILFIEVVESTFGKLGDFLVALGGAFVNLVIAAEPFSDLFFDIATGFLNWVSEMDPDVLKIFLGALLGLMGGLSLFLGMIAGAGVFLALVAASSQSTAIAIIGVGAAIVALSTAGVGLWAGLSSGHERFLEALGFSDDAIAGLQGTFEETLESFRGGFESIAGGFEPITAFFQEHLPSIIETGREYFTRFFEGISVLFSGLGSIFSGLAEFWEQVVGPFIGSVLEYLGPKVEDILLALGSVAKAVGVAMGYIATFIGEFIIPLVTTLFASFQPILDVLLSFSSLIWEGLISPLLGLISVLSGDMTISEWFADWQTGVAEAAQAFTDNLLNLPEKLAEAFLNTDMGQVLAPILSGIGEWFAGLWEKVGNWLNWFIYGDSGGKQSKSTGGHVALADGGMIPGYTPGRDVHVFYSPTAGILELSGGEPVLRPEAGRVLGTGWVDGINSAARSGGTMGVRKFLGGKQSHAQGGHISTPKQSFASGGTMNLPTFASGIVSSIGTFFTNLPSTILAGLATLGEWVWTGMTSIGETWSNAWDGMSTWFSDTWVGQGLSAVSTGFQSFKDEVWSKLTDSNLTWEEKWTAAKDWFSGIWSPEVKDAVSGTFTDMKTRASDKLTELRGTWDEKWNGAKSWFNNTWAGRMTNDVGSSVDDMKSKMNDKMRDFRTAWTDKWNSVKDGSSRIFGLIVDESEGLAGDVGGAIDKWLVNPYNKLVDTLKLSDKLKINFSFKDAVGGGGGGRKSWGKSGGQTALATGGFMPGYTPGRDVHTFYSPTAGLLHLSGGEPVMRPEFGAVVGKRWVDEMNMIARTRGVNGVRDALGVSGDPMRKRGQAHANGGVMSFANGGVIPRTSKGIVELGRLLQSLGVRVGEHPAFGGVAPVHTPGSWHYRSGALDLNTAAGQSAGEQAYFDKLAPILHQLGWGVIWRYPGHYGHLHVDLGNRSMGSWNRNAAGSKDLREALAGMRVAGGGGGGGGLFDLKGSVKGWLDKLKGRIGDSRIADLGFGMAEKAFDGIVDTLGSKFFALDDGSSSSGFTGQIPKGAAVTRWTSVVRDALEHVGQPATQDMINVVLRRLKQESGGNPRAINLWDSNAKRGTPSKGLMQVIDPTFRAYRDKSLVNDIWDPLANIVASMRYAMGRYGSLPAAYNRKGGYALGGLIDLGATQSVVPSLGDMLSDVALLRDNGGRLPQGLSVIQNNLGHDETVIPETPTDVAAAFRRIEEMDARSVDQSTHFYGDLRPDPRELMEQVERVKRVAAIQRPVKF